MNLHDAGHPSAPTFPPKKTKHALPFIGEILQYWCLIDVRKDCRDTILVKYSKLPLFHTWYGNDILR